jgi:hypothetical protein
MRKLPFAPSVYFPNPHVVELEVRFRISGLTPRGVRQHFIGALRSEIARAQGARDIDVAVAEELCRALPTADLA